MDYTELNIPISGDEQAEIVTAMLADFPFDSFTQDKNTLKAYIPKDKLVDCMNEVGETLTDLGISGFRYIEIETQNWNALWESNFEPVDVAGRCAIRAPFHAPYPDYELDIIIMPKMSFGTGHHATTHLVTEAILDADLKDKSGLDMGSGTGVLAIVAVKRGATHVDAVDIDDWAYENCIENIETNGVAGHVTSILGDVSAIAGKHYDFILANINRNILLADMERYVATLNKGGVLIMSGILEADIPAIVEKATKLGLTHTNTRLRSGWAAIETKY